MLSAILTAVTIFFSVIVYLMLRGKDFVSITAKGAGRINPDNKQHSTEKQIHAAINYTYPFYNIAGLTTLWNICSEF